MKEIDPKKLNINPMEAISDEWMLISAGKQGHYNTMTASWGHLGSLWGHGSGKPTAICYIRPQRYTKQFVDEEMIYTLTFFPKEYKKALAYLGTHSGRDEDKVAKVGLTQVFSDGSVYFKEASLVLVCKKLYVGKIEEENFLDPEIVKEHYPKKDFHTFYIGEIIRAYVAE